MHQGNLNYLKKIKLIGRTRIQVNWTALNYVSSSSVCLVRNQSHQIKTEELVKENQRT